MKRKNRISALFLLLCLMTLASEGQVASFSDQFLINNFLTNPAIAGTSRKSPLTLSSRQQWLGIGSAPKHQTLTFHKSMVEKKQRFNPKGFLNRGENAFGKVGIGGGLFNLSYGSVNQFGLHGDYAYHVYLKNGRLSLGLAGMYQQFAVRSEDFIRPDGTTTDPLLDPAGREVTHFVDASAGVHYASSKFFAGASVINLFNSQVSFGDKKFDPAGGVKENPFLAQTFYAYGGMMPAISKNISLKPSLLVKYSQATGAGFQANLLISLYDDYETGIIYRFRESVGLYVGVNFLNLILRYQFEYPAGSLTGVRFITHQVSAGYLL